MHGVRRVLRALPLILLAGVAVRQILLGSWKLSEQADPVTAVESEQEAALCFVIRTYWGHGPQGGNDSPLVDMLTGLVESTHSKWEALILVMDSKPFYELSDIVRNFSDPRIKVFAEKVGDEFRAKLEDGSWNAKYHDDLYSLTDTAIQACSPATQWLIVTNGDNEYDSRFIHTVVNAPGDADIIAFDFYSRYQRVTAEPCRRFAAAPGAPPCKENLLRFCNTDLAATVYRWPRFMAEERAFSKMESHGLGLNDGLLAHLLRSSGWKVRRVSDACLLSHSPSPQLCALHDGVWDDSVLDMFQHSGGRCLDMDEAKRYLAETEGLEVVEVDVSHDGTSFGFAAGEVVQLACIRRRFEQPWVNQLYPEQCAAAIDGGIDY